MRPAAQLATGTLPTEPEPQPKSMCRGQHLGHRSGNGGVHNHVTFRRRRHQLWPTLILHSCGVHPAVEIGLRLDRA
jgi:hypothetical protein